MARDSEEDAVVTGRVTRHGEGVEGAKVYAYRSFGELLAGTAQAVSAGSDVDGGYSLVLPSGTWYLLAGKGKEKGPWSLEVGGMSSYHGSNPFTLRPKGEMTIDFSLAEKRREPVAGASEDPGTGTLTGRVIWQGAAAEGVLVRLYLDAESDFRGMGYAAAPPTGEDGTFRFDYLPESDYFLLARKRAGGGSAGPLGEGDLFGYYVDNPVGVGNGTTLDVEFEVVAKGREAPGADSRPRASGTTISGNITDASGAAVSGAYAFAYEEQVMAHKKPAFISSPAGEDGRYVIFLARGGTWYIGARSEYGDSPAKGEWYGRYDGSPDHSVTVDSGRTLAGIDIVVERILP
jgi:hypothetical protein